MLGTAVVLQLTELSAWSLLYFKVKRDLVKRTLLGTRLPTRIPVIDNKLKEYAGVPSNTHRKIAKRITALIQHISNTQALELLILGLLNGKSKLRHSFKKSNIVIEL